ncbi:hypothetical protein NP493_28g06024 [Ridgeia piscesae]|uniref:Solute carrier family 23 member 2 n=1 Tax=Ridgeia piscesae TaxID=27915 RepID=A0AAD9UKC1_RIDPI|nr:hypothetical protein NP493_28g06024 [Ridgeia piscesae]
MTTDVEETLCLPKEVSTDIQCEKPSVKKTHNAAGDPEEASRIWRKDEVEVHYRIEETPPIHFTILFALQHYMSMFVSSLTIPILLAPAMCMEEDNVGKSEIIGTLFVTSGIITLMQNIIGVRLPIVQAGTFALLVPTLAYLKLPQWECPTNIISAENLPVNASTADYIITGSAEHREVWMTRLREVQGAILVASLIEVFMGLTGIVGVLLRYIGPLSICPTIGLLGLSLFKSAGEFAAKQWWICILTIALMILFSQYMGNVQIPCMSYSRQRGCGWEFYPLLKMFPVIFAIVITWVLSIILTATNVFPDDPTKWGYQARTDLRTNVIFTSPWFRFPYPGQWGWPTVSVSAVFALASGIIATTIESIGDYHACAKVAGAPPPPLHAVNRGILVEGLGSFLDGMFGTGNGTTSTSINVGVIGITKVGSRHVVMLSAVFMIVFGVFTKFGALFVTIPDPVIAGTFFILFGMIVAVGLSNLQYVDLNSSRNLFIIGFSFFTGLTVPHWVGAHPKSFNTGSQVFDNVCVVLLSTSMFVGGMTGFIFDNTIPGTQKERGLEHWQKTREAATALTRDHELEHQLSVIYDLPYGMAWIRRHPFLRRFPFSPTFRMRVVENNGVTSQERPILESEKIDMNDRNDVKNSDSVTSL